MQVYLVRHIDTKEIQGIFWGSLAEIWDIFDEIGDPADCEYAPLEPGALRTDAPYGEGHVAKQDALTDDDEDEKDFSWSDFSCSETFDNALHGQSDLSWSRFDFADEGNGLLARIYRRAAANQ